MVCFCHQWLSRPFLPLLLLSVSVLPQVKAAQPDVSYGREMMLRSFEHEVREMETSWLEGVETLADWEERRQTLRRQLVEMLGLQPAPPKTNLQPQTTGTVNHTDFTVEKIQFQSMPGLYVTANLYLPKKAAGEKVPAVLYLCGHAQNVEDGISFGNKTNYQHHPAWYARQGIACLIIDTIDRGEIRGVHHGTYRLGRWWWQNRGYTPGAAEVWNAIRSLDYLGMRPEIDMDRVGATGRSGGGIYSWLLLALDDRVRVSTPTAGLTDLRDHLLNDCIRGHCDCNYWNNFHRLDTTVLAALAAPRPVKLLNTEADPIFPTSGIRRIDERVKKIYALYGEENHWKVFIGRGDHKDTRELQVETFRWMVRWLTGKKLAEIPEAEKLFDPEQLRVFEQIPADEINTRIDEKFRPAFVPPDIPRTPEQWDQMKKDWTVALRAKPFAGWPEDEAKSPTPERVLTTDLPGGQLQVDRYSPQTGIDLRLWTFRGDSAASQRLVVRVLDAAGWLEMLAALRAVAPEKVEEIVGPGAHAVPWPEPSPAAFAQLQRLVGENAAVVCVAPRGIGPTFYEEARPERGDTITRSFPMLGQTIDGMRIWDVRRALAAIRHMPGFSGNRIEVEASRAMAGIALYASLFDKPVDLLRLTDVPATHDDGPFLLNIDQILDLPQVFAMASDRTRIVLEGDSSIRAWRDAFPRLHTPLHQSE